MGKCRVLSVPSRHLRRRSIGSAEVVSVTLVSHAVVHGEMPAEKNCSSDNVWGDVCQCHGVDGLAVLEGCPTFGVFVGDGQGRIAMASLRRWRAKLLGAPAAASLSVGHGGREDTCSSGDPSSDRWG